MTLAALLVQMTKTRCKRLHMELDEGLVHRDAMKAHQERRNPCFGTPIRQFSRLSHGFGRWWRSAILWDPDVGGTFDCSAGHVVPHAIDDS
jgi:hypothetical protein